MQFAGLIPHQLLHRILCAVAIAAEHLDGIVSNYPEKGYSVRGKGMMQALDVGNGALVEASQ